MGRVKFFLLAGGYGQRAQPLSFIKPKPLFPLHGTPLIQILLGQLKEKGLNEGFVNLHYLPDPLRKCIDETTRQTGSPVIHYFYEDVLSGSRIIKEAAAHMADDDFLLVVNGDIFLDIPVTELLAELLKEDTDGILLVRANKEKDTRYKTILSKDNVFSGRTIFSGSDRESMKDPLMYPGVSLFKKHVVRAMAEINFFDMLERSRFKIKLLVHDGIWLDIGDPASYYKSNLKYKTYRGESDCDSISKNVIISPDSLVKDCIIWENTEIRNRSILNRCIIAGDVCLDHVEYNNKIISRDSQWRLQTLDLRISI